MRFQDLTEAVGQWSVRNFGEKQNPYLGMIEEVGELSHCLLKRQQGIRGFENPSFFIDHYIDALGDICIYAANFAYNEKLTVSWPRETYEALPTVYIASACFWLSQLQLMPEIQDDSARRLFCVLGCLLGLAKTEGLVLEEIAEKTWEVVSIRDWKVNSQDGNVPV